jgi:N-acetylglucosamine PTS system EIICBA or EIICB component
MAPRIDGLQSLGRALMLPIAVLPVAGLLLRLGQPDLLGIGLLAAAGDAIFTNLGMLFAVGVAVGLARENHGAAALAGLVGFLVAGHGTEAVLSVPSAVGAGLDGSAIDVARQAWRAQQVAKLSMPLGILAGLVGGVAYNRYADVRLPSYLAFFGGRRFVPIVTGCAGLAIAAVFGFGWPFLARAMDALSRFVLDAGPLGLFAYGMLNRALLVTGLHHILNNIAWFLIGDYHGVTGDLKRFFAGDPSAGAFMSGFFPVMMFGLPGACLAMYHTARDERRRAVAGLLGSLALTSLLTGVTEPIEFTFMFLAPALYALHALLTGTAMVLMQALGVKLGFGFSAGLFDYVLNFSRATRPWLLLPVGCVYFAVYYLVFRYVIVHFDLATPGREAEPDAAAGIAAAPSANRTTTDLVPGYVAALGGRANLRRVDACTTRLRLEVADSAKVDVDALLRLGAIGVLRPTATAVQVVLGPLADQFAAEIRAELKGTPADAPSPGAILEALGGAANLAEVTVRPGRLLVIVRRADIVDEVALCGSGVRDAALVGPATVHLILGDPEALARQLR